jgi:hypothetical protein
MRDLPVPPYDLALNTAMQTVATIALWAGTIALLACAYRLARQERSFFPLLLVLPAHGRSAGGSRLQVRGRPRRIAVVDHPAARP